MSDARTDGPLDRITVAGITAIGYHGVFEHERLEGQTFVADVTVHVDSRAAAAEDRLDLTVDYGVLAEQVAAVLAGEPADLVETVAERVAAVALTHPGVHEVDVVLHKPQAPVTVPFADVRIEIHRGRMHVPAVAAPPVVVDSRGSDLGSHGAVPAHDAPPVDVPGFAEEPYGAPAGVLAAAAGAAAAAASGGVPPVGYAAPGAPVPVPAPVWPATGGPATPEWPMVTLAEVVADLPGHRAPEAGAHVQAPAAPGGPDVTAAVPTPVPTTAPAHVALVEPADRLDLVPAEPVDVVLALGSNVGASQEILRRAVQDLDSVDGLELTAVAPLARTGAVGGPEQPDYLNTVVLGRTRLSARQLLHACQAVENAHGRVREERWGPRTIDIDIVVHGSTIAAADDLELPHPRAHERAFVLEPWAQVAPDAVLPGLGGGPVAALAQTAPDREGIRWIALDWWRAPEAGS